MLGNKFFYIITLKLFNICEIMRHSNIYFVCFSQGYDVTNAQYLVVVSLSAENNVNMDKNEIIGLLFIFCVSI